MSLRLTTSEAATPLRVGRQLAVAALLGAPLVSRGSAIANEHFDDPLPFNMDGRIAFGAGPYSGLDLHYEDPPRVVDQLQLYDEDTPEKLEILLDALDKADYISMSSGRLWQSIHRGAGRRPARVSLVLAETVVTQMGVPRVGRHRLLSGLALEALCEAAEVCRE